MGVKKRDNLSISPWIQRFSHVVRKHGHVLDLAAGGGRHSAWFLDQGHDVTAIDRKTDQLEKVRLPRLNNNPKFTIIEADLENKSPWPLANQRFDAVIVVNYLHRPLFSEVIRALCPGGLFLYDTFAVGQEAYGKPSHPDFLLRPGELLERVQDHLQIVAFEQGLIKGANGPALKQRIAAIKATAPVALAAP